MIEPEAASNGPRAADGAPAPSRSSGRLGHAGGSTSRVPVWLTRAPLAFAVVLGAWATTWLTFRVLGHVRLVVVPLVLAIFPTIVLYPVARVLKDRGVPPAAAAASTVLAALLALAATFWLIGRAVADQFDDLGDQVERGYGDIRAWLVDGPLGYDPGPPGELWDQVSSWAVDADGGALDPTRLAVGTLEVVVAVLLGIVALFFYLKDGERLVRWIPELLTPRWARHVDAVGASVWSSVGGYFRGQLVVALVDAVFIGIGLVVLDVPLALPLAALVFFGGFFPIVGATATGLLAAVVAFTDGGVGLALAVVALVLVVQQLEGNVLEPFIVGRATRTHPLVILIALSVGGVAYGLLGAFLAVPVAAAGLRVAEYALEQRRAHPTVDDTSAPASNRPDAADPSAALS